LKRVGKSEKQEYSEVNAPLPENSYLPEESVLSSESETSGDGDPILSGVEALTATPISEQDMKLRDGYFDSQTKLSEPEEDSTRKRSQEDSECLQERKRPARGQRLPNSWALKDPTY
jgi:hypothetical protein